MFLNAEVEYENPFNIDNFKRYLRYVVIEGGMGGMFTYRSPREFIEGYNDPIVALLGE